MIEHRIIERMIAMIEKSLDEIESTKKVDPKFVDTAVDFIRMYADRTHHGKEEDILFSDLSERDMSDKDRKMMEDLIEEHAFARKTTKALVAANERYRNGDETALTDVADNLRTLAEFYPKHIDKEDNEFFPASREYYTNEEEQAMLDEFWEFDRKMIHEKYKLLVEELESRRDRSQVSAGA
jgi:hemerythrin-like domain-containing protein